MQKKPVKKRKHGVIYYPAPKKSGRAYFVTAFLLTFAFLLSLVGFAVADANSRKVGWNKPGEVFAVSESGKQIDITVLCQNLKIDTGETQQIGVKLRRAAISVEPEPLQFAAIAFEMVQSQVLKLDDFVRSLVGNPV